LSTRHAAKALTRGARAAVVSAGASRRALFGANAAGLVSGSSSSQGALPAHPGGAPASAHAVRPVAGVSWMILALVF
jgi:hypothetical protein